MIRMHLLMAKMYLHTFDTIDKKDAFKLLKV